MGNEESSSQQSTKPKLTQSKTWASALDHLPRAGKAGQKSVLFRSETKKSTPIKVSTLCCAKTLVSDSKKDGYERLTKSMSSKDSYISKLIESSFEDSSSIIVIERLKNCKLVAPSHLQNVEFAKAAALKWTKRRLSGERTRGIDVSEYSPSYQLRSQTSTQPVLSDIILLTNDEIGLGDIRKHYRPVDRFSFGDTANFPKYPSFLDSSEGGRISTGTPSDLSFSGTPLNISLLCSDAHHVSESVVISWPYAASSEESLMKLNCLSCVKHTLNERGLNQPEYSKQDTKRIDFTSKLFSGSSFLGVLPVKNQYSTTINQKLPMEVTTIPKVSSSLNVIKAD